MPRLLALLTTALIAASTDSALAEGTAQLNTTQALRSGVQLFVDILHPGTESIRWTGVGCVSVATPNGTALGTLNSGDVVSTAGQSIGAYSVRIQQGQVVNVPWDVEVVNQVEPGGRLFSYDWGFNAGRFAIERATYASFYAILPGGGPGNDAVIELKLDGLAGYVYNINANRTGVDGPNAGRSVSMWGHTVTPEFPIYLNPPTVASYSRAEPGVFGLDYLGGVSQNVQGATISPCNMVAPGDSFGRFQFYSNVEGTYHLQCDLDGDGLFENTNNDDFLRVGSCSVGVNTVLWDGMHQGGPVPVGSYNCRVRVNVGEFHYVGSDIETSFEGMRMFEVLADGSRRSLAMHWNDQDVQSSANAMPSGAVGLATSGEAGMDSGDYTAPTVANGNARSWGNFSSSGKGNRNYLDTYVWLASSASSVISIQAVDPTLDQDNDGLSNFEERCFYGTDPANPDTDNNGTLDGAQYASGASSGSVGGLESNGRLAQQLARRAIARTRYSPDLSHFKVGQASASLLNEDSSRFRALIDAMALADYRQVESTPGDLPELTNATDVYALDFLDAEGRVAGSLLAVETRGELYEHSKALCDRAGGSTLLTAGPRGSRNVIGASFQNPQEATLDHALELKLYQEEDALSLHSHWLRQHYPSPKAEQRILNIQIWGRRPGLPQAVASSLMDALEESGALRSSASFVLDEDHSLERAPPAPITTAPTAVITSAELLGANLTVTLDRFLGPGGQTVELSIHRVAADGEPMDTLNIEVGALSAPQRLELDVGHVRDLTLDVLDNGRLVDQLWLSDGAWAQFDDSLWGGGTVVDSFQTDCEDGLVSRHDQSAHLSLSGCATVSAQQVDQFVGVARHITRGLALGAFESVALSYISDAPIKVCIEDTSTGHQACRRFERASKRRLAELSLTQFKRSSTNAHLVVVTQEEPGALQVSDLKFSPLVTRSDSVACGCSTSSGQSTGFAFMLFLGLLVFGRSACSNFSTSSNCALQRLILTRVQECLLPVADHHQLFKMVNALRYRLPKNQAQRELRHVDPAGDGQRHRSRKTRIDLQKPGHARNTAPKLYIRDKGEPQSMNDLLRKPDHLRIRDGLTRDSNP